MSNPFLLLPDAASLWRLFFLDQTATLSGLHLPPWERRPLRLASHLLQGLIIGGMLYHTALDSFYRWRQEPAGHALLCGAWVPDKDNSLDIKRGLGRSDLRPSG